MTLEELQKDIAKRWGSSSYGDEYNARTDSQRDAHHATLHITKSLGKIAGELDNLDHGGCNSGTLEGALADIIICAAQVANRWPEGQINIEKIVLERMAAKFPPAPSSPTDDKVRATEAVPLAALMVGGKAMIRWTAKELDTAVAALSAWVASQYDAAYVMTVITAVDRNIGAWIACALARTVLGSVPPEESYPLPYHPRLVLEMVERAIRGEAKPDIQIEGYNGKYSHFLVSSGHAMSHYRDARAEAIGAAYAAAASYFAEGHDGAIAAAAAVPQRVSAVAGVPTNRLCGVIADEIKAAVSAAIEGYARE